MAKIITRVITAKPEELQSKIEEQIELAPSEPLSHVESVTGTQCLDGDGNIICTLFIKLEYINKIF